MSELESDSVGYKATASPSMLHLRVAVGKNTPCMCHILTIASCVLATDMDYRKVAQGRIELPSQAYEARVVTVRPPRYRVADGI